MDYQLHPRTGPGREMAGLIEARAEDFAATAALCDQTTRFPHETIAALDACGALKATLPPEFGGLGLIALHDFAVAMNRLARADASVALAVSMHLFRVWGMARAWRGFLADGDTARAAGEARELARVADGAMIAAVVSEAGTDLLHPMTEAAACPDGWRINGRKIFATGSPAARILAISVRLKNAAGHDRMGRAHVPTGLAGVEIGEDWDALGMRGSGSHDVVFRDVHLPPDAVVELGPWGEMLPSWVLGNMAAFCGLVGVFLGIAEAAQAVIVESLRSRRRRPGAPVLAESSAVQLEVGENETDLHACRAVLARTTILVDDALSGPAGRALPLGELHALMQGVQMAKQFVTRRAIVVVDRALGLSGGAGYMAKHPLARLYRDVRAGPFMQPWPPAEGLSYVGAVALGQDPASVLRR